MVVLHFGRASRKRVYGTNTNHGSVMYIIEMHHKLRAFAQIVLEKGDTDKPYEAFMLHQVIINHSGDVDPRYCKWCLMNRKEVKNG